MQSVDLYSILVEGCSESRCSSHCLWFERTILILFTQIVSGNSGNEWYKAVHVA